MAPINNLQQQLDYLTKLVEQLTKLVEQNTINQKEVLTIEDAAYYTGRSRSNVYKLTHRRVIPHYKPHGSRIYLKKQELIEWMLQNPVKTAVAIEQEAATYTTLNPIGRKQSRAA